MILRAERHVVQQEAKEDVASAKVAVYPLLAFDARSDIFGDGPRKSIIKQTKSPPRRPSSRTCLESTSIHGCLEWGRRNCLIGGFDLPRQYRSGTIAKLFMGFTRTEPFRTCAIAHRPRPEGEMNLVSSHTTSIHLPGLAEPSDESGSSQQRSTIVLFSSTRGIVKKSRILPIRLFVRPSPGGRGLRLLGWWKRSMTGDR